MLRLLGVLSATALFQTLAAENVRLVNGDILLTLQNKQEIQITHDGLNREAVLSPDGSKIAYLRGVSSDKTELVVVEVGAAGVRPILTLIGPIPVRVGRLPLRGALAWSPDSESVYFLLEFSSTSNYIGRLTVASGKVRGLCDAISYFVLQHGKYAGKLVALKRRHTLVSVWDWYWLIDETGAEIGPIGDREALSEFIDRFEVR